MAEARPTFTRYSKPAQAPLQKPSCVPDGVWHSGPPPSIGWWPASVGEDFDCLRWWNGKQWSMAVYAGASPEMLNLLAACPAQTHPFVIRWAYRPSNWPKESYT